MPPSRPPGLDRPGGPAAPALLRRPLPVLIAAVVLVLFVLALIRLSRMDGAAPAAAPDLTPACGTLSQPVSGARLPAGLPTLPGQFVTQTGQVDRTSYTFTAVADPDLDAVLAQVSTALRAAGHRVTVTRPPPAQVSPARDYSQLVRQAVLTVAGPAGTGTVTVSGRCTDQTGIGYTLTPN
jgi:hypothetical protein